MSSRAGAGPMDMTATIDTVQTEDRRRWFALVVLCVGMLMIVLDVTVVNVALPSIQADLGFSQSSLAWVVNAYLISFGGLLLLAGRLGDLVGRKRVFMLGLALFTAASLACGVAQSQAMLIAARFAQGVGGAMTSAVILGMIVTMFPEPREQAKAIGIYGFVASAGGSIGLLAGGVLTEAISWHWIFFINLPIAIGTAVAAARLIPGDRGIGLGRGADVLGATLVTGALMLGVYTIVKASEHGWASAAHARPRRRRARAARAVRRAPGAHREPADAAARVPLAQRVGRQRRPGRRRGGDVQHVLPRHALPAARARPRTRCRSASRSCPRTIVMGMCSAVVSRAAGRALRRAHHAGAGARARADRAAAVRAPAGRRRLPRRAARRGARRHRRRALVPGA